MKNPRAPVQSWDDIKDDPRSSPASCSARDEHKKIEDHHSCHDICGSCSCDNCMDTCHQCLSCCFKSCSKCCYKCVRCTKGLRRQGWKKWCLFGIVSILLLIVVLNLALTLWIMQIMEFSYNGMGSVRINSEGLELTGNAYVMDQLVASTMKSKNGQPMSIVSYDNFTIKAADDEGKLENLIFFDNDTFSCRSKNFVIEDADGKVLFSTSGKELIVGAKDLKVTGKGGIFFNESVVTPKIESYPGQSLSLQSLTRQLFISSAGKMLVQSKSGGIEANTLKDIHFKSRTGTIKIDSSKISMPSLRVANLIRRPRLKTRSKTNSSRIYQVCVCENGRLFLARPTGSCEMYDSAFICK